ncbi:MAG: hypothetical protein A2487_11330 [Candidatus Raymondbacteria bacterium RifOxyC12_full_50_8]|uniref:Uncharacterized protein TP-0789 domain-containing protein n=1 Tax=Candidatus Raymondbacteria bacterium RIFOXYD12_FULL_49_13 TaxID=1817890 RepID=A0A1F7FLP7_UNCRA|nr:MAG: hypothetical protein A2248_11200 [Candidatus Raymondbacteria bacterium RIFOXYA2_FULL_49_16]OGJ95376.1 MAG: hypothetical protein A2453_09330 [Candidatus Raymondbacteria bacterium RIFOXYC2_FULL_50_21]OGJ98499.1 MAG: hypothetical protein A2350_10710 [Candidatus Raymondbacteria bacterium RifOxyB12_full_50_8]OGK03167.1 MAG: hypothetical protein A2487_11330 [Candidatus Raymondbacteria bacterium RifOxyC12_full_50_8]OGK07392.1 MAG: hypothetical protein A2519_21230 [Candidatus Raymondbacteria ba
MTPTRQLCGILALLVFALPCAAITAEAILDSMEANESSNTARTEMTQAVYAADNSVNESKLVSWSAAKGEKGLMEYVSPARIKGMKILMLNDGDDIWFYSARTARVRKIASHQKNQSVNNSDFSYEDLSTKEWRKDYTCALTGQGEVEGVPCHIIELKSKKKSGSYSKIVFWVDTQKFVGREAHFYDENNTLWKKLFLRGVSHIGKYWTAKEIEMKNVVKGTRTVMTMDSIAYDIPLDEAMFTERSLKQ